jgi:C4-dicarboxylate-specific signal transduction histidine kinase
VPSQSVQLKSDPHAIEQALVNLVLNAIEAVANSDLRQVVIRLTSAQQSALIDVIDSGPGVSSAIRNKLFEPFATNKPDGVGLGLATARDLVRALGGEIELVDAERKTCFRMRLPRG